MKLDENLGERGRQLFADAGHDVATVVDQGLSGSPDRDVIEACRAEQRCLVTLDLDFSNPLHFPPTDYAGIAVLRLPRRPTPDDLYGTVGTLINAMQNRSIAGGLWIIERHRIREYQPDEDDS